MKHASVDDALSAAKSGSRVFVHGASATPLRLLEALVGREIGSATSSSFTCTR